MPVVNPGIRRQVAGAITRLFNSASFSAPLTHTAVPQRAATGTTATFTRATTATFRDWEGVLKTVPSGCARFEGARMVRNLLLSSENLLSGWIAAGAASVTPDAIAAPTGAVTADALIEDNTSAFHRINHNSITRTSGQVIVVSVYAKYAGRNLFMNWSSFCNATGAFDLQTGVVTQGAGTASIEEVGDGWYRCSVKGTCSSTGADNGYLQLTPTNVSASYAGDGVSGTYFWGAQLEEVTGQADQSAGEYVSVGVESAPYYHGSFVDGVKCFATDLAGNALTTMLGYLAEGARTNIRSQSNSLSTTWTLGGTGSITQNATGPDGATSAWTCIDTDAAVCTLVYGALLSACTASNYTASVFVKKTVGVQASYPIMFMDTGSNSSLCTIDTSGGVATVWTARTGRIIQTSSASCVSFNDDFWRVSLTWSATAELWSMALLFAGTTNPTQSTGTEDNTAQGSAVFYGAQVELGSFASSYIATTTIAVARNADVLTYSSAGNISDTAGWAYAEYSSNVIDGNYGVALSGTGVGAGRIICHYSATNCAINDATTELQKTGLAAINTGMRKRVATWAATPAMAVTGDGLAPATTASYDGTIAPTAIAIGYRGITNIEHIFGNIGPIYIGQRQLSASEMQAITA